MKTTQNKTIIGLVNRLSEVIETRKSLDTEEKSIKAALKDAMAEFNTNILGAGNYVMIISDRTRSELDKELVKSLLGEKYDGCIKKSEYQIFEVKKA